MGIELIPLTTNTFLAVVAGFGLQRVQSQYPSTSLTVLTAHGIVGMIKSISSSDFIVKTREVTTLCCDCLVLPFLNAHFYGESGMGQELVYVHLLTGVVPLVYALITKLDSDEDKARKLIDLSIFGNVISMAFLTVYKNNGMYGGVALAAFLTKFAAQPLADALSIDIDDATNVGYTVLAALALRTITGSMM